MRSCGVKRAKVISCEPSYHGATLGALSATGDAHTLEIYGPMVRAMPKVPGPTTYRLPEGYTAYTHAMACADALETTIEREGPESVLAFMLEPIGGVSSGAVVSPEAYSCARPEGGPARH